MKWNDDEENEMKQFHKVNPHQQACWSYITTDPIDQDTYIQFWNNNNERIMKWYKIK